MARWYSQRYSRSANTTLSRVTCLRPGINMWAPSCSSPSAFALPTCFFGGRSIPWPMFIALGVEPWEVINLPRNIEDPLVPGPSTLADSSFRFFILAAPSNVFGVANARSYSFHIPHTRGVIVSFFCCWRDHCEFNLEGALGILVRRLKTAHCVDFIDGEHRLVRAGLALPVGFGSLPKLSLKKSATRAQDRHSATATHASAGDSNLGGSANLVRATWKFRRSDSAEWGANVIPNILATVGR